MPSVVVLPEAVANQIAAGEVVERPASVVKELVENALDAGARSIRVEILGGGLQTIAVTDDGCGMEEQDALLAVRRHATSKLRSVGELQALRTLGFRGEALPSIASVSRFSLTTAPKGGGEGSQILVEGGSEPSVLPAPGQSGTTVEVKQLFWNVPARRKFLKRPSTELAHVSDAVSRLALAHEGVRFSLKAEGRSLLDVNPVGPSLDRLGRIGSILGKSVAEQLVAIPDDRVERPIVVLGFSGAPPLSERGSRGQYVFVNGRFIRDQTVQQALQEVYRGRLLPGRKPVAVLFLKMSPLDVDINVHPQKTEVRFQRPGDVFGAVQASVRRALTQDAQHQRPSPPEARLRYAAVQSEVNYLAESSRPAGSFTALERTAPPSGEASDFRAQRLLSAFKEKATSRYVASSASPIASPPSASDPARFFGESASPEPPASAPARFLGESASPEPPASAPARFLGKPASVEPPSSASAPQATPADLEELGSGQRAAIAAENPSELLVDAGFRIRGVWFGRYLAVESAQALRLYDVAAAQARIAASAPGRVLPTEEESQPLLIPVVHSIDPATEAVLRDAAPELDQRYGLSLRVEPSQVVLLSAPVSLRNSDLEALLRSLVSALLDSETLQEAFERAAPPQTKSTPVARIAEDRRSVEAFLEALQRCEGSELGLDGKPLSVRLTENQVARLFGRNA